MNHKRFQVVKQVIESRRVSQQGQKLVASNGVKFILPKSDKQ